MRDTKNARGDYSERTVPLAAKAEVILRRRATASGPRVFSIPYQERRRAWDLMRRHLGVSGDAEFVPHTCRHTFGSRLAQRGVDLYQI